MVEYVLPLIFHIDFSLTAYGSPVDALVLPVAYCLFPDLVEDFFPSRHSSRGSLDMVAYDSTGTLL